MASLLPDPSSYPQDPSSPTYVDPAIPSDENENAIVLPIVCNPDTPAAGTIQFWKTSAYQNDTTLWKSRTSLSPAKDGSVGGAGGKGSGKSSSSLTGARLAGVDPRSLASIENQEIRSCLEKVNLEMDLSADKPWRSATSTSSDFFNYDFNERTFREYIHNQIKLRFEKREKTTLGESGRGGLIFNDMNEAHNNPEKDYLDTEVGGGAWGIGGWQDRNRNDAIGQQQQDNYMLSNLYTVGFPRSYNETDLYKLFSFYGEVKSVTKQTLQLKVSMLTAAMASSVIKKLNGIKLEEAEGFLEVRHKIRKVYAQLGHGGTHDPQTQRMGPLGGASGTGRIGAGAMIAGMSSLSAGSLSQVPGAAQVVGNMGGGGSNMPAGGGGGAIGGGGGANAGGAQSSWGSGW